MRTALITTGAEVAPPAVTTILTMARVRIDQVNVPSARMATVACFTSALRPRPMRMLTFASVVERPVVVPRTVMTVRWGPVPRFALTSIVGTGWSAAMVIATLMTRSAPPGSWPTICMTPGPGGTESGMLTGCPNDPAASARPSESSVVSTA